jgi:hypothetical protein
MASLITSIIGGFQGRSAISDARAAQVEAALKAAGIITDTASAVNQTQQGITNDANADAMWAYESGTQGVKDSTTAANDAVLQAVKAAQTGVTDATAGANARLDPYASAGSTAVTSLSDLANNSTFNFEADPGYEFRLDQGAKALARSQAARGSALGGAAGMSLARYAQDYASNEYQRAFDRFRADRSDRTQTLTQLANYGFNASTRQGANDISAGTYAGDIGTAGAQWTGDRSMRASEFAANAGMQTARTTGDRSIATGRAAAANTMNAAEFNARMQLGIGDAEANEHLGRAASWNSTLSQIGRTGDAAISAGYSGGGGWNWGRAARGAAGLR